MLCKNLTQTEYPACLIYCQETRIVSLFDFIKNTGKKYGLDCLQTTQSLVLLALNKSVRIVIGFLTKEILDLGPVA